MTRVESILKDPAFLKNITENQVREADRKFCGHSFQHLVDVARIAYILMLESGEIKRFMAEHDINHKSAKELIYASALLHDIGRWKEYETGIDHAMAGAELAIDLLQKARFKDKEITLITTGIREHRRKTKGMSVLGGVLYRADKLSRLCCRCSAKDECYKINEMETGYKPLVY